MLMKFDRVDQELDVILIFRRINIKIPSKNISMLISLNCILLI